QSRASRSATRMAYAARLTASSATAGARSPSSPAAIETMPVAITSANAPRGSSATPPAARRPSPLIGLSVFERVDVPQEPRVQREAAEAGEGGGQQDVGVAAQERVHRRGQQPELQHHQDQHDAQDPGHDHLALAPRE